MYSSAYCPSILHAVSEVNEAIRHEAESQGQNWPRGQRPNIYANSYFSVSFAHQCYIHIIHKYPETNNVYLVIICYCDVRQRMTHNCY